MTSYRNNPRYSSVNIEEAVGIFKAASTKGMSVRSGVPTISKYGFTFSFRSKVQKRAIMEFLKVYKSEGARIDRILNELSPKQAAVQLKLQYNFSNSILKSII